MQVAEQVVYSQNAEQQAILAAVDGNKTGRLLDIGAFDGRTFSNSLALIELGWSGVLVEPALDAFKALLELHGKNDRLALVQAVVGCNRGLVKFWDCGDVYSTTEGSNLAKWKDHAKFKAPYHVPQISLAELLDKFPGPYDVVSIDTEGSSSVLFSQLIKLEYSQPPKVIVVEHDGREQACLAVAGAGYAVAERNAENLVLVKR